MKPGTVAEQEAVDERLEALAEKAAAFVAGASDEELAAGGLCGCEIVELRWRALRYRLGVLGLLDDVECMTAVAVRVELDMREAASGCARSWHRWEWGSGWVVMGEARDVGVDLGDSGSVRRLVAVAEEVAAASGTAVPAQPFRWEDVMRRVPSELIEEDCDTCRESPRVRFL